MKTKMSMSYNKRELYLCLVEKMASCLWREEEAKNEEVIRKWARILEFDENSFLATCKRIESPGNQNESISDSFQGVMDSIVELLCAA